MLEWWQALVLGLVQGLTEFLPVSSSGHLAIFRELTQVDAEADVFLGFTVLVHFATVCSTLVVFWKVIWKLIKGLFKFQYNDETDYIAKLVVSMIPVGVVGLLFKDQVEGLFGEGLVVVGCCLLVTALLLWMSDLFGGRVKGRTYRNGISFWQAFIVGIGQAFAVAPGLSRSGTTIATGLLTGVRRDVMAQFSFLMVLAPILGEQLLDVVKSISSGDPLFDPAVVPPLSMVLGFVAAFAAGLFACKAMIALVRRAKLWWFSIYCVAAAILVFILG